MSEGRGDPAFEFFEDWDDAFVEEFDLVFALFCALEDFGVGPPAEETDGVHVAEFGGVEAGFVCGFGKACAGVSAVMAEEFVDGAVEGHEGGNDEDGFAAFGQNRSEGLEGAEIVFDVFEDVEADDAVGGFGFEVLEFGVHGVEDHGADVLLVVETGLVLGDAVGIDIDTDDVLTVCNHAGEVADAAADFYDALAEWGHGETGLPLEIVDRARHALLVTDGVVAGCGDFAWDQSSILSQRGGGYTGCLPTHEQPTGPPQARHPKNSQWPGWIS